MLLRDGQRSGDEQVAGWVGKPVQLYINEQLGPMVKLPSSVSYYSLFFHATYNLYAFIRALSLSLSASRLSIRSSFRLL